MARIYLGLGSNVEPERNLRLGIRELQKRFGVLELSRIYRNGAVGFEGPDFLNLVVALDTTMSPMDIDRELDRIHKLAGRSRTEAKFASRPLDIDLLLYGDLVQDKPPRLPRADVLEYAFVLGPLADIAPALIHPLTGVTIAEHWRDFDHARHPLEPVDVIL